MNRYAIMRDTKSVGDDFYCQPIYGRPVTAKMKEMKERKEEVAEGGWKVDTHATTRKKKAVQMWQAMLSKGTDIHNS